MKPDRELDAMIAEKVLGCVILMRDYGPICVCAGSTHCDKLVMSDLQIKHYSTDITAAWEVVENIRKRNFWVRILQYNDDQAFCEIIRPPYIETEEPVYQGSAKTAPMAICITALKTVGIEVKIDPS